MAAPEEDLRVIDASKQFQEDDLDYDEDADFLGSGGYAEVYKAKLKKEPGGHVAFKIIYRRRRNKEQAKDLEKEAGILLNIQPHPHIIKLVGICNAMRCYGILMEYIDGKNLKDLLQSDEEMRIWGNRLEAARQIADGMAHLHGQAPPIIHQDLKPDNVLIEKEPGKFTCKICDFGLSKMKGINTVTSERASGEKPSGSVVFIAPERYYPQRLPSDKKTEKAKKSDVYSFGVILWEIRELQHPYHDELESVIHENVKSGKPLPAPKVEAPGEYNKLQFDCATFEPANRPSFEEARDILVKLKEKQA